MLCLCMCLDVLEHLHAIAPPKWIDWAPCIPYQRIAQNSMMVSWIWRQIGPQREAVCPHLICNSEGGRTALGALIYTKSHPNLRCALSFPSIVCCRSWRRKKKVIINLLKNPPNLDGFQLNHSQHGGTIQNGFQNITANSDPEGLWNCTRDSD